MSVQNDNADLLNQYRSRWKKYIQAKGEAYLNDDELAKKGFHAIQVFIDFRKSSYQLVKLVFPEGQPNSNQMV